MSAAIPALSRFSGKRFAFRLGLCKGSRRSGCLTRPPRLWAMAVIMRLCFTLGGILSFEPGPQQQWQTLNGSLP